MAVLRGDTARYLTCANGLEYAGALKYTMLVILVLVSFMSCRLLTFPTYAYFPYLSLLVLSLPSSPKLSAIRHRSITLPAAKHLDCLVARTWYCHCSSLLIPLFATLQLPPREGLRMSALQLWFRQLKNRRRCHGYPSQIVAVGV